MKVLLYSCVALQFALCVLSADPLGTYNTDPSTVSVSGFSSGASFSTQIHVAISSEIYASSILTGSPYGCNINADEMSCFEKVRNDSVLIDQALEYAAAAEIDPVENMEGSNVFVWVHSYNCESGSAPVEATVDFYNYFGADVMSACNEPNGHGYPTLDYGNPCPNTASPYINDCDFNMAFVNLDYLLDGLDYPAENMSLSGQLLEYDQAEFVPEGAPNSFDEAGGFIYVPSACESGDIECRLHVFFHGCSMGREFLGDEVVRNVGLLEVAETNNIVTLFPQLADRNGTRGCWDVEGYEGDNFATKSGTQVVTVQGMIHRVLGL